MSKKQVNLSFDSVARESRLKESVDLLRDSGFLVFAPPGKNSDGRCKNINDLVTFFYYTMYRNRSDREIQPAGSLKDDRKNMSIFLKSRQTAGISKKRAVAECEDIIEAMIINEKCLSLDYPITSTLILTQKWAVDKAITIINNESKVAAKEYEYKIDRTLEFLDVDEAAMVNRLDEMYSKVVKNG